jgi:hypothetical protein
MRTHRVVLTIVEAHITVFVPSWPERIALSDSGS